MGIGKQSKILTTKQQKLMLTFLDTTRNSVRNKVIFLLSTKLGLRSKEISNVKWVMVTDTDGNVGDTIELDNKSTKGNSGGILPMCKELQESIRSLQKISKHESEYVIVSERQNKFTPQTIVNTFSDWYKVMGLVGCSSHSGRRTFITNCSKKIMLVGGSIRDVQKLSRHSSLQMTQRYIEHDVESMKRVVELI